MSKKLSIYLVNVSYFDTMIRDVVLLMRQLVFVDSDGTLKNSKGEITDNTKRVVKELIDKDEFFSLTFLDEKYRNALNYCGSHSGRNENKIANESPIALCTKNA